MIAFLRRLFGYRWITQTEARDAMKKAAEGLTPPKPCDPGKVKNFAEWAKRYDTWRSA